VAGFIGSPSMNFLKGTVADGAVVLPGLGGRRVETDVALPSNGTVVLVGVRPQHLSVTEGSDATLDIRERLGGVAYDYLVLPDGEKVIVETRGDEDIPEGASVDLHFEVADAMFFHGETEQRLR